MKLKDTIKTVKEKKLQEELGLYAFILNDANNDINGEFQVTVPNSRYKRVCDELEQAGFLRNKDPMPEYAPKSILDLRKSIYVITDEGKKLLAEIKKEDPDIFSGKI